MITLLNRRHAAIVLRALREQAGLSLRAVAALLHVEYTTLWSRERHKNGLSTDALIDTARVLGYDVALIPARYPNTRPTGTGWPT